MIFFVCFTIPNSELRPKLRPSSEPSFGTGEDRSSRRADQTVRLIGERQEELLILFLNNRLPPKDLFRPLIHSELRLDITYMVDWALENNYPSARS